MRIADHASGLRVLRAALGLTQQNMADACAVSVGHVSAIEKGRRQPSPELARRLADALGIEDLDTAVIVEIPPVSAVHGEKEATTKTGL